MPRPQNQRFREHDVFRDVFERIVAACIKADLVGGTGFAVDASLIAADANKCRSTPGHKWSCDIDPATAKRAVRDYLANLDDPAWGTATDVVPKFVAPADPAAQWTGALRNAAFFAYADNYLIDVKFGVIMDVEASRAIRQAEVGASQTMIELTEATFGIKPEWLVADTAYGSAPNLHFLVYEKDSIFDYATYAMMLYVFVAWNNPSLFQTGWFVESLLTQTLIIHVIRTAKIPFIESHASPSLITTTVIVCTIGMTLPFTWAGSALGFVPLPWQYWPLVAAMLVCSPTW